jgi:hypothetical protein
VVKICSDERLSGRSSVAGGRTTTEQHSDITVLAILLKLDTLTTYGRNAQRNNNKHKTAINNKEGKTTIYTG